MSVGQHLVPLDRKVWQAWVVNNRRQEEVYFARRLRVTMFLSPLVLAIVLFWLFGR
jgi:hypothetical protein